MKFEYMHKTKCPIAPFEPDRDFDSCFEILMRTSLRACKERDKSVTGLIVGDVGSGKSSLACHAYEIVDPEPSVERIAHDTESFAKAIKVVDKSESRFLMHDEFNISSRDAMKGKNKDLIDLLFSIRGENWFLIGNNPSSKTIDKDIIEEGIVNWVIFINRECSRYLFFTRKGFLDLIKEHGSSSFYNLKTYGAYFAFYEGWFKEYKGNIWNDYINLKRARMKKKKDLYVKKYATGDTVTTNKASDYMGCSAPTAKKVFDWGNEAKLLVEDKHFVYDGAKNPQFTVDGVDEMKRIYEQGLHNK